MHELSIAESLADLVTHHAPRGEIVHVVYVTSGPLRGIDPQAMQWAWQAATEQTPLQGARLELSIAPWQLRCLHCERRWESRDPLDKCPCGSENVQPTASDELTLDSIEIEDTGVLETTAATTMMREVQR